MSAIDARGFDWVYGPIAMEHAGVLLLDGRTGDLARREGKARGRSSSRPVMARKLNSVRAGHAELFLISEPREAFICSTERFYTDSARPNSAP